MGRQRWVADGRNVDVTVKLATSEAWVCGGGGGGGAHVKALVEMKAGQTYRIEVGDGGTPGSQGNSAQNGRATRLLQRTEASDWKVLAEAAGGFGAGKFNADFQYSPGGQGGFSSPHRSHVETHPGSAGSASRSELVLPSKILPPERLVGPVELVCDEAKPGDSCMCDGTKQLSCSGPWSWDSGGLTTSINVNGQALNNFRTRVDARLPCGDIYPPRIGCRVESPADWFLTCSSAFRLGSTDSSFMHCHGAAIEQVVGHGDGHGHAHPGPWASKIEVALQGPLGGSAVVGRGAASAAAAGHGGGGFCPVMLRSGGEGAPAVVQGHAGSAGKAGLATLSQCRRRGAYVLALQRCRAGRGAWTLHGLWPEGAQDCSGDAFRLGGLGGLRARMSAAWPSCSVRSSAEGFWEHEWRKHGTCFGTDQMRYFELSLQLLEKHSGACAGWTSDECRLCLTADFELCAGLSDGLSTLVA
ncbi:unnamed protein product [Prorocentrum cordatum]|uniref:Glycine-rich domain-containing protein n=1 Tax=Prorocentrum cordatum TaxID=2364126 RepID=A0ABN9UJH4_9DINO|nr:unnamed protein product [Polarella glacialis]